jgi:hypothetical protein
MGMLFYWRISRERLTEWGLTLLAWALIAVVVLSIAFAALTIIINPPSLYSLVAAGVILLAIISWQLTKLTSKR